MKICVLTEPHSWHFQDLQRAAGTDFEVDSFPFEKISDTVAICPNIVAVCSANDAHPRRTTQHQETLNQKSIHPMPPSICGANDDIVAVCSANEADQCLQSQEHSLPPHPLEAYDTILARAMPGGSLQQVVFRMDVLLELERRGLVIVNPPRTIEMSVDKYLSLTQLHREKIPVPATGVSQTFNHAMEHFEAFGGQSVIKPLFGSMGRGLLRIKSRSQAEQEFAMLLAAENVIYQQAFIDHGGFDLRLLVIGERVLGMKRVNSQHWITNIAQGATGYPYQASPLEIELAIRAARAVGAGIAGVDVVYDQKTGQPYVLEVNSAPSWRAICDVLQIDVARMILEFLKTKFDNTTARRPVSI